MQPLISNVEIETKRRVAKEIVKEKDSKVVYTLVMSKVNDNANKLERLSRLRPHRFLQ